MKNLKKIVLCFVLILSSLFFFGCSTVSLSITLGSQGNISAAFKVNLNDITSSSKRSIVYNIFKEYYSQLDSTYYDNLIRLFEQVYDNDEFNNLEDRLEKVGYITTRNVYYLAGETKDHSKGSEDNYKFLYLTKEFASIYAYLMYFCPSAFTYNSETNKVQISKDYHSLIDVPMASADNDVEEYSNLFITQYIQDFCPFYYNNEEPEFLYNCTIMSNPVSQGDKLVDVIMNMCGFTQEEADYYFSFTTPYKRLHSTGEVEITTAGYTHSWTLSSINSKVAVWRTYANYAPWYAFVIIFSLVGLTISLIVIKVVKNKEKKKGLELLQKIDDFQQNKK